MKVSIIIPTYNRAPTLSETLASIFNANFEGIEIIVVDNGSTDDTATICRQFKEIGKIDVRYYYDPEPGLLTGRHLGASAATGEILCFLDDDVELSPSWLEGVRNAFTDTEVQLATGPSLPKYETEPPEWLRYFWSPFEKRGRTCFWLSLMDLGTEKFVIHPTNVWGLNFCIRKAAFIELGGFHPDNIPAHLQMFQGDGETGLAIKALEKGYKALYHPSIKVYHLIPAARLTYAYFQKRAYYQGICNSFSHLRTTAPVKKESLFTKMKRKSFRRIFRRAIERVNYLLFTPQKIKELQRILRQKEKEGYRFHQEAFNNNQKVREWVLKEDYFDYKLPP
jgi:glycosyltransferase involved in cell wall biosynthesis